MGYGRVLREAMEISHETVVLGLPYNQKGLNKNVVDIHSNKFFNICSLRVYNIYIKQHDLFVLDLSNAGKPNLVSSMGPSSIY